MPYYRIEPSQLQPDQELVDALARELSATPETNPLSATSDLFADTNVPDIQEEVTHRNIMHVRVIWDRWSNISPEQRGGIILEAYKKAQGDDVARRISIAMGLTAPEAKRLGFA